MENKKIEQPPKENGRLSSPMACGWGSAFWLATAIAIVVIGVLLLISEVRWGSKYFITFYRLSDILSYRNLVGTWRIRIHAILLVVCIFSALFDLTASVSTPRLYFLLFDMLIALRMLTFLKKGWHFLYAHMFFIPIIVLLICTIHAVLLFALPQMRAFAKWRAKETSARSLYPLQALPYKRAAFVALVFVAFGVISFGVANAVTHPVGNYIVHFENPSIEQAVRKELDMPTGFLRRNDVAKIQVLYIKNDRYAALQETDILQNEEWWRDAFHLASDWDNQLENLRDLRHFTGLQAFALDSPIYTFKNMFNFMPLKNCKNLEELYIAGVNLCRGGGWRYPDNAMDMLPEMPSVRVLKVERMYLSELDFMERFPGIEVFSARNSFEHPGDLSPFATAKNLRVLDFDTMAFQSDHERNTFSLSQLAQFPLLEEFNLGSWRQLQRGDAPVSNGYMPIYLTEADTLARMENLTTLRLVLVDMDKANYEALMELNIPEKTVEYINHPGYLHLSSWDVYNEIHPNETDENEDKN